jgi:ABC-type phosphate transport system substrate-binding protein
MIAAFMQMKVRSRLAIFARLVLVLVLIIAALSEFARVAEGAEMTSDVGTSPTMTGSSTNRLTNQLPANRWPA